LDLVFLKQFIRKPFKLNLIFKIFHTFHNKKIEIYYKNHKLKKYYVPDFLVFEHIVIEIKSMKTITRIEEAQIINSIKSCKKELGLLINFGELSLNWKRYIYTDKY